MAICGHYCVQDSVLVMDLFFKTQQWIDYVKMAKTCGVPIYLYTQGQQIKVYSQIYKYCLNNGLVVEKDACVVSGDDAHFMGAKVFEPIPGVYDMVLPFDFKSLYPTIIIAYNIDYSTLVLDPNIPDSKCNVIEFSEHHDVNMILILLEKKELDVYIDKKKEEIKGLRVKEIKKKKKLKKNAISKRN